MNKKQIETLLLHYVTIAMEQANQYKEIYNRFGGYDNFDKPLSQEEIDALEYAHEDLELQLKAADNSIQNDCVNCSNKKAVICDSCLGDITDSLSDAIGSLI